MLKRFLSKLNYEVLSYLAFGVLTTAVNYVVYYAVTRFFNVGVVNATVIAWVISVLFAFVTNKLYVFKSLVRTLAAVLRELCGFVSCRVASGLFELVMMWLFVEKWTFPDMPVKVAISVVVVILNYLFSKWWIFKN